MCPPFSLWWIPNHTKVGIDKPIVFMDKPIVFTVVDPKPYKGPQTTQR